MASYFKAYRGIETTPIMKQSVINGQKDLMCYENLRKKEITFGWRFIPRGSSIMSKNIYRILGSNPRFLSF